MTATLESAAPAHTVTLNEERLAALDRDGFVVIPGALSPAETELFRVRIEHARTQGWEEGLNSVGNMWFDTLLDREPEHFSRLVGHPSVRPLLEGLMGRQCQLRNLRAHINPGKYVQEWHMDFYGYWREKRDAAEHPLAAAPIGLNTTFYFQDNKPGRGRLTFLRGTHRSEPPHLSPFDQPAFCAWSEAQERVVLHPNAGHAVVFYSHIVHQGAKEDDTMERSNVVVHYQACAMHERAWHVAPQRGFAGTFPFA